MYEFFYHIKFRVINEILDVKIFLSLDDLFTPVYIKTFETKVLKDKELFLELYKEFFEYLDNKNVVINENDLRLLHQTIINFNLELPKLISVEINKYDEELDSYSNVLTPKELVFIQYADGKGVNDKRFKSWEEDNNLDTKDLREKFLNKKILTTDNYEFNLRKAKRELLLEVINKYELDVFGDNNDLIEGIIRELSEEVIKEHFSGTHYTLTNKGRKLISKVDKLLDFNRSYYRTINKLPLEEFHLLSIKKEDYDFNGIGRLLMINNNNVKAYFDWDTLNILDEFVGEIVQIDEIVEEEEPEDILSLLDQINSSYKQVNVEEKKEEVIEEDTEEVINEELYIEENLKIKAQLEAYKQKREIYEKQKEKGTLYSEEVYSEKSKNKFLIILLIILGIIALAFGLLFLNEKLDIIKIPFTLKDIFDKVKEFYHYCKDKIVGLFK